MDEVNILKNLRHPCIISIRDVYDTPTTLYIVLELWVPPPPLWSCDSHVITFHRAEGGELFDRVVSSGGFPESTAKLYFYQLVQAIKVL